MSGANKKAGMKRELTPEEKEECEKLKALYLSWKAATGKTQEQAADILGFKTQGAVSQYLNGKLALNLQAASKFAKMLNCHVSAFSPRLAAELPPTYIPQQGSDIQVRDGEDASYQLQPVSVWDDDTPIEDDEVEVPFYKEVEFAAGSGAEHGLEINGRRVRYGRSSLRAAGVDPHNAACGKATGNSMEPLIQDGSLVGIDRGKTQILDGEIYALDQDGMLRVKFVYRLPGGGLRLRSFNQDEHPDETYSAEDARSIKILGWVWTWSPPIRKWRGR